MRGCYPQHSAVSPPVIPGSEGGVHGAGIPGALLRVSVVGGSAIFMGSKREEL